MLQGAQAERRPKLYVDGGDVKVDEICKAAKREAAESGGTGGGGVTGRRVLGLAETAWRSVGLGLGCSASAHPVSSQDQSTLIPSRPRPFKEPCYSSHATFSAHPPAPFPVGRLLSGRPQEGRIGGNEKHPVLQVREPAGEAWG